MNSCQDIASNNAVASPGGIGSATCSEPFRAKLNDAFIKKLRPSERPVGDFSDFGHIDQARDKARELAQAMGARAGIRTH